MEQGFTRLLINKKNKFFYYLQRDWQLYLLLVAPFAILGTFRFAPMYGLIIAFKDFNLFRGIIASEWVGLAIFKEIFSDKEFFRVVRNTFMLNGMDLVFGFPAPIILALLLNEIRLRKFKRVAQTVLYLPHFLSWIIIGGIAIQLFADRGLVNIMLSSMGFERVKFLTDRYLWLVTYCFIGIWQSAGWGTIIYLAAITGVNPELYDAADVDGASRLQMVFHVTIPGIMPTVVILLILNLGRMAAIGFDRPFLIGNTMVREFSDVISTYAYRIGIRSGYFSQATAVGFFQSLVNVVFLLTANYIAQRLDDQHGLF